jgi:hypothetical protein
MGLLAMDVDGDGRKDLLVAGAFDHTLRVLRGHGDGTFHASSTFGVGRTPVAVGTGTLVNNQAADVMVANQDSNDVTFLWRDGTGGIGKRTTLPAGPLPNGVAAAHLNMDAYEDVVVSGDDGTMTVLLGRGDGTFHPPVTQHPSAYGSRLALGELTGDAHVDAAMVDFSTEELLIFAGDGAGSLFPTAPIALGFSPNGVTAADLDTDGFMDLAVARSDGADVAILYGTGAGPDEPVFVSCAGMPISVEAADVDGDGGLDLAVVDGLDTVQILLQHSAREFAWAVSIPLDAQPFTLVASHFDADGALDLAVTQPTANLVAVLLFRDEPASTSLGSTSSNGSSSGSSSTSGASNVSTAGATSGGGSLSSSSASLAASGSSTGGASSSAGCLPATTCAAWAECGQVDDGCGGFLDCGVCQPPEQCGGWGTPHTCGDPAYRSDFAAPVHYLVGRDPESLAAGDFNGDGRMDLAVACTEEGTVEVLLAQGDGTVRSMGVFPVGETPVALAAAYLDNERYAGTVVVDGLTAELWVLKGTESGLEEGPRFPVGLGPTAVNLQDLNGDLHPEALVTSGSDDVAVFPGTADGFFGALASYAVAPGPAALASGHLNGDGLLDVVTAHPGSGEVTVLQGLADGGFLSATRYPACGGVSAVAVADVTWDGLEDAVVTCATQAAVATLPSRADGGLGEGLVTTVGTAPVALATDDFNGDGKRDVAVAFGEHQVSILLGRGDGTFVAARELRVGTNPKAVLSLDLDGDGRPDVVTANANSADLTVLINQTP